MDRTATLRNLLLAGAVFCLVMVVGEKLLPTPKPKTDSDEIAADKVPARAGESQENTAPTQSNPSGASSTSPTQVAGTTSTAAFQAIEADLPQTVTMGADPAITISKGKTGGPYRMGLLLSNIGASVESATMADHADTLDGPTGYRLLTPLDGTDGRTLRSMSIEKINVDGVDVPLLDRKWHVGPVDPYREAINGKEEVGERVEFQIDLQYDGAPALRITRELSLPQQSIESGRHDLRSKLSVENLSAQPFQVVVAYQGGLGLRIENTRADDRVIDVGIKMADGRVAGQRHRERGVVANQSMVLYAFAAAEPARRVSWAAIANTYFTCTVAPLNRGDQDVARYVAEVAAIDADGSTATVDDVTLRFVTMPESVPANGRLEFPTDLYLGEKDGETFRSVPIYVQRNYYSQIAHGVSWCTFSWLVEIMVRLLNGIHSLIPNYGVAIIVLVLIVRLLLHPITKKGQVNMVRMQQKMGEFGPKLEELKKRLGNDKARLQQEQMKLYREGGINPGGQLLTCLPMLIQMPIWVALWISLSNNVQMRHEPFFLWIRDLAAPDAIYTFATPWHVPLLGWAIPSINLLPFLVAASMYVQQKLQPKPAPNPNMTQQQKDQQEMMQRMGPIMSVMMLVLFYNAPSGLTLYIAASNLFGTLEQARIRKHIKEREATGTLHRPERKVSTGDLPTKRGGIGGWFDRLQKMAEEVQKTQRAKPRR